MRILRPFRNEWHFGEIWGSWVDLIIFCIIGEAIVTPFIAWLCLLPLNFEWELKSRDFLRKCRPNMSNKNVLQGKRGNQQFSWKLFIFIAIFCGEGKINFLSSKRSCLFQSAFFLPPPWLSLSGCQVALEKCKYFVISLAEKRREKLRRSLQRFLSDAIFCFLFSRSFAGWSCKGHSPFFVSCQLVCIFYTE